MKRNKNLILTVSVALFASLITLTGCNKSGNKNSVNSVTVSENVVVDETVSSIKDAITKLAESKNYTVEVSTKTGPMTLTNNLFYTENAFYDDFLGDEYGYAKVNEGVYKFDRYARKYTPSAILKDAKGNGYDSIWGKGLFYAFSDLDLSEFDSANGTTFSCTKKKNKLSFMHMFGIDQTKYTEVAAIEMSVGTTMSTFVFNVKVNGGSEYTCTVKNYGNTKIEYLENATKNGETYYEADETLAKVISLFEGMNYTHFIYDTDYDKVNPVGYEKFTENYFISGYTNDYIKYDSSSVVKCSGMVGFDNYKVNDSITLNGSYWSYVMGESYSLITSFYYNEDPYVPNVYTYPTFLKALSSPQYFESAGIDGLYYTSKMSIVKDFCTNFQLWDALNENDFTPCGLFINYDKSYNGQDTVTFKIQYDYYGLKGTTDFVFSDFGTTSEKIMEKKYAEKYVQAYYNGIKAYVKIGDNDAKKLSIKNSQSWILDEEIAECYEGTTSSLTAGTEISFSQLLNGEQANLNFTLDSASNDYLDVKDGKYYLKQDGRYTITVTVKADKSVIVSVIGYNA